MYYKIQQKTRRYCTRRRSSYSANRKFQPEAKRQNIVVKWNLDDKLKLSNIKRYTGNFVSSRECVNLVTHTNFITITMSYRSRFLINTFNARASGGELERRFTKFVEITQCNCHYAVQRYSRLPILVPIESLYTTSY